MGVICFESGNGNQIKIRIGTSNKNRNNIRLKNIAKNCEEPLGKFEQIGYNQIKVKESQSQLTLDRAGG